MDESGGREVERLAGGCDVSTLPRPADDRPLCDAVAAAAWRAWWTDDAIKQRTLDEIALAEVLAIRRIRAAGLDIREAIDDWPRAHAVVLARADGYRPLERTPDPWPPESLDRDTWRDDQHPFSTNVPVSMRFRQVYPPRVVAA